MESVVDIVPFVPEKHFEELKRNAANDNHAGVYFPTHVSVKDGEIVGYLSIGVVPMILTWQHTQKVGPLDSLQLLGFVKGALQGYKTHIFPCDPASPYNRLLPKAGYIEYTKEVKLYIKDFSL